MSRKPFGEYPIVERSPYGDALQHDWKKHKWLYKEKVGGKTRYFYTEESHQAFLMSKKGKKTSDALAEAMTDRLSEKVMARSKKSKISRFIFGGWAKDIRDSAQRSANNERNLARVSDREAQVTRAKAASLNRQYKKLSWKEKFAPEGRQLRKEVRTLRRQANEASGRTVGHNTVARGTQRNVAAVAKLYRNTTLGLAESRTKAATSRDQAQDRYDAAVDAAKKKRKGKITSSAGSVSYQREFMEKRKRERDKKGLGR